MGIRVGVKQARGGGLCPLDWGAGMDVRLQYVDNCSISRSLVLSMAAYIHGVWSGDKGSHLGCVLCGVLIPCELSCVREYAFLMIVR